MTVSLHKARGQSQRGGQGAVVGVGAGGLLYFPGEHSSVLDEKSAGCNLQCRPLGAQESGPVYSQ